MLQKLRKLYKSVFDDRCLLVVVLTKVPGISTTDGINGLTMVKIPVIMQVPYVRSSDVSFIEFNNYVKSLYSYEVLLIPVKHRWLLKFIRHGTDYNQNYNLVERCGSGLNHHLVHFRGGAR
jgi:hypothetical protein